MEDHATVAAGTGYQFALHQYLAGIGMVETGDQAENRGLSTAGWTQQDTELAGIVAIRCVDVLHLEIDIVDGLWGNRDMQARDLKDAAAAMEDALQVFTRKEYPEEWARLQCNRGIGLASQSTRRMGQRRTRAPGRGDHRVRRSPRDIYPNRVSSRIRRRGEGATRCGEDALSAFQALSLIEIRSAMLRAPLPDRVHGKARRTLLPIQERIP